MRLETKDKSIKLFEEVNKFTSRLRSDIEQQMTNQKPSEPIVSSQSGFSQSEFSQSGFSQSGFSQGELVLGDSYIDEKKGFVCK